MNDDIIYDDRGRAWKPDQQMNTLIRVEDPLKLISLKPVPNELGFYAHICGKVYAIWRDRGYAVKRDSKRLIEVEDIAGYVNLYNGVMTRAEAVLSAFDSKFSSDTHVIIYVNNDKADCSLDNLRYREMTSEESLSSSSELELPPMSRKARLAKIELLQAQLLRLELEIGKESLDEDVHTSS